MSDRTSGRGPSKGRNPRPSPRSKGPGKPSSGRPPRRTEREDEREERPRPAGGPRAERPASKRAGKRPPAAGRGRAGEGRTERPGRGGRPPLQDKRSPAEGERGFGKERREERPRFGAGRPGTGRPQRPGAAPREERSERPAARGGRPPLKGKRPFGDDRRPAGAEGREERPRFGPPRTTDRRSARPVGRGPDRNSKRGRRAEDSTGAADGLIRLNRYLAQSGVASRREADDLIKAGVVQVNGVTVTELGTKVAPGDRVHYGGQRLSMEKKRYVLVNKPKDFITTTDDPQDRRTVMALIDDACSERLYPVGRLDRNTTGVLLMTNDGDLAKKLTHPSHGAEKIYHATLDKAISRADLEQLVAGVELEDGPASAEEATFVQGASKKEVGLKLHMGRNRVVRRMFEALGYDVVKLDRVVFAGLTKKDLPRGKWRHLTEKEVLFLSKRK